MTSTDDDPLLLECASLRKELAHFQDEAYQASLKFQHHQFDVSQLQEQNATLEMESSLLREEISVLRSHPLSTDDPRIPELTLSLRKLSTKLAETENNLLSRIQKDTQRESELFKHHKAAENAYELAAHCRAQLEEARVREAQLLAQIQVLETQCQSYDATILDYAALVRSLEAKEAPSTSRSEPLPSPGQENHPDIHKVALRKLSDEFAATNSHLHQQLAELNASLSRAELANKSEAAVVEKLRSEVSSLTLALEKLKADDLTASSMVERYMKFTQAQSAALHATLDTLNSRHASATKTLHAQLSEMDRKVQARTQTEQHLRNSLDELGNELMKEKLGRRREILLKIGYVETLERLRRNVPSVEPSQSHTLASTNAIRTLTEELRLETARRIELELVHAGANVSDLNGRDTPQSQPSEIDVETPSEKVLPSPSPRSEREEPLGPQAPDVTLGKSPASSPEQHSPPSAVVDPVIVSLRATSTRYEALSHALRNCYDTLVDLQHVVATANPSNNSILPTTIVQAALDRLRDYTEDTRVELEIRAGDESLLAQGFETLLLMRMSNPDATLNEIPDLDGQIQTFIAGTDPGVQKAMENLSRKAADIEHDVAIMKRAVYEPALALASTPSSSPAAIPSTSNTTEFVEDGQRHWSDWLARSPSPRPDSSTAPPTNQTFGNIMASRSLTRLSSAANLASSRKHDASTKSHFASLGLKVPMPSHFNDEPASGPADPRQRKVSTVLLGLGPRSQRSRVASGVGLGVTRSFSTTSLHKNEEESVRAEAEAEVE